MGHVITPIDKAEVFKNEKKTDDKKEQGQDKFKRSKAGNKRHKGKSKGRNKQTTSVLDKVYLIDVS